MGHTLTIRLQEDLAEWLEDQAAKSGVSQGQIVREQLERARSASAQPFMRLAGSVKGARNLSQRKGFSKA
jgi:Ribbon-helix-helix protein, copG family